MVTRDELTKYIEDTIGHDLLTKANKLDPRANGVQVIGKDKVEKIVLGVSCSLEFLTEAVSAKADYCLFHHGLDLATSSLVGSVLNISQQQQLKLVFSHELSVAGYHYVLDAQSEFGNNATIIKLLGAKRLDMPYFEEWGWVGEFTKPVKSTELAAKLADITSHDVFAVYGGKNLIKRIGVCSGGAKVFGNNLKEILEKSIDVHVTGKIAEGSPALAKEAGFNIFVAGHYATEVFGVQELGKKIKEKFGDKLEVEFIDIPNIL